MEIKIKSYNKQSTLIEAIILFIIGAVFYSKPDQIVKVVSIGLGITLTLFALVELIIYFYNLQYSINDKNKLATGIPVLITGIIFIFFANIVELFIRYIVGGGILLIGIIRLLSALSFKPKRKSFFSILITSLIIISLGIYTIVVKNFPIAFTGLIIMIYSGIEIIEYIIFNNIKAKEELDIIISEKNEIKSQEKPKESKKEITVKNAKIKEDKKNKKKKTESKK